jgi:glycosyltransferase involved in cell wall biosynthesis
MNTPTRANAQNIASRPKVSAVITIYNAEDYLNEALERICNQTLQDIEIVCVDDGSSDGSVDILTKWATQDARLKIVLNQNNLGAAAARNRGLEIAQGEYIIFLDDDDLYELDMLRSAFLKAQDCDADIVIFRARLQNAETGRVFPMDWSLRSDLLPQSLVFSAQDIERDLFRSLVWWAWDKLFRRDFVIESGIKFQLIHSTNDLFFTCALFLIAKRICYINDTLLVHRAYRKNSLSSTREISYESAVLALKKLQSFMEQHNLYGRFRADFQNYIVRFLKWQVDTMSGESFYLLFNEARDYINFTMRSDEALFDEYEKLAYRHFVGTPAEEYLFHIKRQLQADLENRNAELAELTTSAAETERRLQTKIRELQADLQNRETELAQLTTSAAETERRAQDVENHLKLALADNAILLSSLSWRITTPLRWLLARLKASM